MTVEDLTAYGAAEMDDDRIRAFLESHDVGVLALPTDGAPSMRPLSYRFDGDGALYLVYIVGSGSRKASLSTAAPVARFLVYSVESAFSWRSVLLTGTIDAVNDRSELEATLGSTGRPDLLERAMETERVRLYRFDIDSWSGIEHTGLPPAFETD